MGRRAEAGVGYVDLDARTSFFADYYSITPGCLTWTDRLLSISLVVCSPSARLKTLAPVFPKPRVREPTAIRFPAWWNRATI
jgi:hypothetical protein